MARLKIYLVERTDQNDVGWDEYFGAVVIARSKEAALLLDPMADYGAVNLTVTEIGNANKEQKENEVILDSFNAG